MKKNFRYLIPVFFFAFSVLNISGCATVSRRESAIPTYRIDGVAYVGLLALCDLREISWDYDTITRKITLGKRPKEINLMVNSPVALVNGVKEDIGHPVKIYNGAIVVPKRFKTKIIDSLFKPAFAEDRSSAVCVRTIKKVIIDPGHGGKDPGATGKSGVKEKDINLDIAKKLKRLLNQHGIKVILTRSSDSTVSLEQRGRIANSHQADLFVSIHANANRVRKISGFEVYYLTSRIIDDSERALNSAREADLNLEDDYFAHSDINLKATLWDLIYTQQRAESIELAQHICRVADNNLDIKTSGIRSARFKVLKSSRMPAILIEVGYLSNRYEEKKLKNSFYRQQIAEAIALGIESYCQGYKIVKARR